MQHHTSRIRLGLAVLAIPILALTLAACHPTGPPAPPPGAPTCGAGNQAVAAAFLGQGHWSQAPGWAQDRMLHVIIPRESGCDPCAFFPGQSNCAASPSTAKGLTELLGHDDLIHAACPLSYPLPWQDPGCNGYAAFLLSNGGTNLGPWGG